MIDNAFRQRTLQIALVVALAVAVTLVPIAALAASKTGPLEKAAQSTAWCQAKIYIYKSYSSSKGHRVGTYSKANCYKDKSKSAKKKIAQINLYHALDGGPGGIKDTFGICNQASYCRTPTLYKRNPTGDQRFCGTVVTAYNYQNGKGLSICRTY